MQMFGPSAWDAIRTYETAKDDADLAGLMGLFGCTEQVMERWKRVNDSVIGMDANGKELVRVPLREPMHVRAAFDTKYDVQRTNCP
jgi:nitrate reductase beta subunit